MMLRRLAAALLAAHGVIHLIGFLALWRITEMEGFAYRTTVLGGSVELGGTGALVLGLAWLVIAIGFVVAAVGTWRRATWGLGLTAALAIASLAICVLYLPDAAAGIAVNVAILGAVAWATVDHRPSASLDAEGSRS
jgi:hypothetical protein